MARAKIEEKDGLKDVEEVEDGDGGRRRENVIKVA